MSDTAGAPGAARPHFTAPLSWFPTPLLQPVSLVRAIGFGWLLAFVPSIIIGAIIQLAVPDAQTPEFRISGVAALGMLVLFAPILETLIMGGVLLVLLRFVPPTWAVIASAIGWGAAHSAAAPLWGLIIWWPFLVFSTLFVAWRSRSLALAFVVPMVVHGLHNLLPAVVVATGRAG